MSAQSSSSSRWRRTRQALGAWWSGAQWRVLAALFALAFVLGFRGIQAEAAAAGGVATPSNVFYMTLQLFTLQYDPSVAEPSGLGLQVARFLAPALAAYAAFQALAVLFQEQLLLVRVRGLRGHAVVCGLSSLGSHLALGLRASGWHVVVLERDPTNPWLEGCRDAGCLVLIGDATGEALLCRARLERSRAVVAVCGNDGVNVEIAAVARSLCATDPASALTCLVHIGDTRLHHLLREQELIAGSSSGFRQEFFNRHEAGARLLLREHPPFDPADDATTPHVVVVGLGPLGLAVAAQVARQWHPLAAGRGPLRLTLVDAEATARRRWMAERFVAFERTCTVTAWDLGPGAPELERAAFLRNQAVTRVYVCHEDEAHGLLAALSLKQALRGQEVSIVVQLVQEGGLARLLQAAAGEAPALHGFPLLARVCNADLLLGGAREVLARAVHDDYLRTARQRAAPVSDPASVAWDVLPEDIRESNRRVADQITTRLQAVGYAIEPLTDWDAASFAFEVDEVERLAESEHARWRSERETQGWRYAPGSKDATRRTSPLLVDWAALPEDVRIDNRHAARSLPAFLARAGFQVSRKAPPRREALTNTKGNDEDTA